MKAIDFPEQNIVLAETQPEYSRLPALVSGTPDGCTACCWKLTFWERLKLLVTGRLWIEQLTFHRGFQPIKPSVTQPDFAHYGKEE